MMSILSCKEVKKKPNVFLSMTSVTVKEFEELCDNFEKAWEEYTKNESANEEKQSKGGRSPVLKTMEDKLFFILFYFKTYPLQEVIAYLFGMSQGQANYWIHVLTDVLKMTLKRGGNMPNRLPEELMEELQQEGDQEVVTDGTERRCQRPQDPGEQKQYYSGKKKTHTVKNVLVVGARDRQIKHLSETCEGKKHDKKIADEASLSFPKGTEHYQDSGFQGYHPEGAVICQPQKKPSGGELTEEEKESNHLISSFRVVVEHVIGGIKRCRIVKDVFRNTKLHYDDLVMEIACGLHNFRSDYRLNAY